MRKRHEPCVLFLDDCFGEPPAELLMKAGYCQVITFGQIFRDPKTSRKRQHVKDPDIIAFCSEKRFMLVTTDSNMQLSHAAEIGKSHVTILATAHNNVTGIEEWVDALIQGRVAVERYWKKVQPPCFATFNRQGVINKPKCFGPHSTNRRTRPQEKLLTSTDGISGVRDVAG
jgi:hypothetical protein